MRPKMRRSKKNKKTKQKRINNKQGIWKPKEVFHTRAKKIKK